MRVVPHTQDTLDAKVLSIIADHKTRRGVAPTQREIADDLSMSVATVNRAMWRLHEANKIHIQPGSARNVTIVERDKMIAPRQEMT